MEKAVVRRGIGAVVLALVAALLLGFLLKGKGPERKEVVNMELPKSPIQIFPEGSGDATAGGASGSANAVAAVGANAVGAVKEGAGKAADTGKKLVGLSGKTKANETMGKHQPVDAKSGNPSLDKSNVVVDGSGQAIYGAKTAGVKNTPANFEFRTPSKREVRPSIDGRLTAKKPTVKKTVKSNARLVGEKKLPPVGKGKRTKNSQKIASSRNKSASGKKSVVKTQKKKAAKKSTVAKRSAATPAGRNKYVVQLLATTSASKANSLKATMAREGYPAYVSKTKRSGKSLYRVRVGSYSGKSTAIKKQASMKRRYRKNAFVQSSIVVRN
ncbi:MAG TPA: SPOR domain-containing protein [Thiothrix sp.]|nr:SPOR domain-containing protein [Thiothrix sp.]